MFYKKVTSRDHKWFFLLRYGDLKRGFGNVEQPQFKMAVFLIISRAEACRRF